ncbi:hypothetical protein [Kitasatospora viridis]|uniref:Esterase n=1 Tax=Kitasatospora viridis TaxID=281105 RepID=A0A561UII4_9ACTN|nr:hypothetical protein [Kitasatospora viridis]TWF99165.1 hypothetical protein FHX73_113004 [Kitasatospora viridis]
MSRPLLLSLAAVVLVAGCWLARGAFGRWRGEQAALVYELVSDLRPVLLRLGGALLCGLTATALAVAALLAGRQLAGRQLSGTAGRAAVEAVVGEPVHEVRPVPPSGSPSPQSVAAPHFDSIGHPAEGELLQGSVPGADGRPRTVRVWLPPHYADDPSVRYPVLVLQAATPGHTADADLPDVFDGLASAIKLGRARPFVVVAPAAPTGTEHPCELAAAAPQSLADDDRVRSAVAAAFRTAVPGPAGWAALGVADAAPCAVVAGLARADLYGAAAGVSGRYDPAPLVQAAADAPSGPAPRLLLAAAKADADGLAAAHRLADALHAGPGQAPRAVPRISDVVQDFSPDRERLRLVRLAAQYLDDTLAHPAG